MGVSGTNQTLAFAVNTTSDTDVGAAGSYQSTTTTGSYTSTFTNGNHLMNIAAVEAKEEASAAEDPAIFFGANF